TDEDGDELTFSATGLPDGLVMSEAGTIKGVVNLAASPGSYPVTVTVTDGTDSASESFTWNVTAGTLPVMAPIGDQTSTEGGAVSLQVAASDPGGRLLTYEALGLPDG